MHYVPITVYTYTSIANWWDVCKVLPQLTNVLLIVISNQVRRDSQPDIYPTSNYHLQLCAVIVSTCRD